MRDPLRDRLFAFARTPSAYRRIHMSEEMDPDFEAFVILNYAPEDISGIEELVRSRDSFVALLSGDFYQLM